MKLPTTPRTNYLPFSSGSFSPLCNPTLLPAGVVEDTSLEVWHLGEHVRPFDLSVPFAVVAISIPHILRQLIAGLAVLCKYRDVWNRQIRGILPTMWL